MSSSSLVRFVNPWKFRRDQAAEKLKALRQRDGDHCARCRRPIRFDLVDGHDQGPKVEQRVTLPEGAVETLDDLCLTHGRCNWKHGCDTAEVKERARIKHEAQLFERSRKMRKRA